MIIDSNNFNKKNLNLLLDNNIDYIVVKNFVGKDLCLSLCERLLNDDVKGYTNAPSIGRIGMAFYEAENKKELLEEYFASTDNNIQILRNRCYPFAYPIDILRCRLDEIWDAGSMIESIMGKKMFVGLARVVKPEITFLAHHDIFEKDAPESFRAKSLLSQIACNVYLQMPNSGGELMLWEKELSPTDFDNMRGDSYGISVERLGKPTHIVRPEIGDLILFNSRKMHAISPGDSCSRFSLSCFIGYRGNHQSLSVWS